jgi:tetratricopeptide (TPR) repeat protein
MNRTARSQILATLFLVLVFFGSEARGQQLLSRTAVPDKLLEQRAASLVTLGRIEEAVDIYLDLLYRDPRNSNLYFRISALLPGQENAPVLLQILSDLREQQPDNIRLAAEQGRLLYILDRKSEANELWYALVEKKNTERYTYTTVSNAMLSSGAADEAVKLLQQGRITLRDSRAFAFELARIFALKHNYALAGREYLRHLENSPGMLDHITNQLIAMLEHDGALDALDAEFDKILETPGDHQAIYLSRAKLYLHIKDYDACAQTVLASDVSRETRHVLGIANDLAGEEAWEPASELYLYVSAHSRNQKEVGEALLKLASSYESRLQTPQRYISYATYFRGNAFLAPDVRMVAENGNSLQRTLHLYDSLQTLLPKTSEAFQASYNIAEIHLTVSGDVDRAMRGYQYIYEQSPNRGDKMMAGLRMVDAWLVKGDTSRAVQTLAQVARTSRLDEDQWQYVTARIKILMNQGDLPALKKELLNLSGAASPTDAIFNDGMELLTLIEGNGGPDDPVLKAYFKAEQKIFQHKLSEALPLLLEIDGAEETIADEAQVRAIQLMLLLGKHEEAAQRMDDFLNKFAASPWRPWVLVWRGEYDQFHIDQPVSAVPYYEELIVDYPGYIEVQKVRVRLRGILGAGS